MKQMLGYPVDLLKLGGNGDFFCPCCGAIISPDDETNESYTIIEASVKHDTLENLLIKCENCSNKILITGFSD